jgi:hypothetical protein
MSQSRGSRLKRRHSRRTGRAPLNRWYRPRIEQLEHRLAPAAVLWVGGALGNWATAANWSTGAVPGAADDVTINAPAVVAHAAGSDSVHSVNLGSGATLQVTGSSFLAAATFTNAGTVVIGAGSTLMAVYTQTGGTTSLQGGNLANFGPPPGNSLAFNGTSDFVQVPSSASLDSAALTATATLQAWVYLNQLPSAAGHIMQIMAKSEGGNDLDLQVETDNRIHFYVGFKFPDNIVSNTVLQAGRWYHVAATYQAGQPGQLQLFVNGVLDATMVGNLNRSLNPYPFTIGDSYMWPGRYWNGLITDVSVWNTVQTQAQIQSEMSANLQGTEASLVAAWSFSEGSGSVAHDATANHNDGSLGNGVPSQEPAWQASPVGSITLQAGTFSGAGTISGNLANNGGTVAPSSTTPGAALRINAGFTQGNNGTVGIGLGGPSTGGPFGRLAVAGAAHLAGTLNVSRVNGYLPLFSDSYAALTFGSRTGDFTTYILPSLGGSPLLTTAFVPAGNPASLVLTGTLSPTTTTLASSLNPSVYGQSVTFTATVSAASGGTPTGTVDFVDQTTGQDLGSVALQPVGGLAQASVVVSGLLAGSHIIVASYTSNNAVLFENSTSSALAELVNPATPTVNVSDAGGTYNGFSFPAGATVTGLNGVPASTLEGVGIALTYYAGNTVLPGAPTAAGNYRVVANFDGSADYTAASASITFTIAQATPTVTVSDAGGTYTGSSFPASATVAGVNGVPGSSLEGMGLALAYFAGNTLLPGAPSVAGTYTVLASFAGSTDYTAASASTSFTIGVAIPTVSVSDAGGTYNGQAFPATATVAGLDGIPVSSLEGVSPSLVYYAGNIALPGAPSTAGTYTVVASFGGSADYAAASAGTTFTIGVATPTVSVSDAGGTYNGSAFAATGTVTGVSGVPASSLEGVSPALIYYAGNTALPGAPSGAGTYTVVASFAGSADYAAASASATFTIGAATPAVSVSDAGGTYSGQPFPATATVAGVNGLPASTLEGVGVSLAYYAGNTLLPGAPTVAGSYHVIASFAGSADYTAASASVNFTIGQASPTVSVSDAGGTYSGSAFPASASVAGVSGVPANSLEGVGLMLAYYAGNTLLAGAPSSAGTYTVVASFAGSADYAAAGASTTFTIGRATLTVTANNASRVYGQANPAFSATITGFVNGETSQVLSGNASLSTNAALSSPAGTYTITVTQGTLSAANYSFVFKTGTLTINPDATSTAVSAVVQGASVALTATVTAAAPGSGTPTGSVDFRDATTGTDLGTVKLSGGIAMLITAVPAGSQVITINYSGDANFLGSNASSALTTGDPIYVLNPSASGALSVSGNADINISGTIVVDSNSPSAVKADEKAHIAASVIDVVGGVRISGHAAFGTKPATGAAFVADPLAGLPVPPLSGHSLGWVTLGDNASCTLSPGVYSGILVSGHAHLTLKPGIYVITSGGFRVSDHASVTGNGVLVCNEGGRIKFSGNAVVNLTAAATGTYAGIPLFQPASNTHRLSLSGDAVLQLNGGLLYAPSALLRIKGNASVRQGSLIVNELHITGHGSAEDTSSAAYAAIVDILMAAANHHHAA